MKSSNFKKITESEQNKIEFMCDAIHNMSAKNLDMLFGAIFALEFGSNLMKEGGADEEVGHTCVV